MKKLTQKYPITNLIHDYFRTFENDLTKPQMGRLKEMTHGIIRGEKAILSEITRQNRKIEGKSIRRQVQQYSDILLNLPLETMITRKLAGFRLQISSDTPLYWDMTDITKKYHNDRRCKKRAMKCMGTTWDGSEGKPGKGYEIMDISLGYEGGCTSLIRHTYSTAEEGYKSEVKELEKVLNMMTNAWGEIRGTLFFDTGGDSDNIIKTLISYEAAFVARMNVNRRKSDRIFIDENGEEAKMMELWSKKAQGMTVWENKKKGKLKKKKMVRLQWRKVFKKIRGKMVPLSLVWCHREDDKDPVVFLTGRNIENEEDAARVYHQYFDRGKEEAVFKCHKDKLGMEKVQLRSFEKVKQLMQIYVLADQILYKLHIMALNAKDAVYLMIKAFLKGAQREITKWAVIDWYDDCWRKTERLFNFPKDHYPPPDADILMTLSYNPPEKW